VLVMAAEAETSGTSSTPAASAPLRTVSVQGVAEVPLAATSSAASATAAYRQAMAAAIADGQSKAQFLAEKAGATLAQVQSIGEGGGSISCAEGVEYQGGQPDFGSGAAVFAPAAGPAAAVRAPAVHKAPVARHHRRHASGRKASAESCTLSTQVALVYQLG
jgi:hypothetical protein